MPIVSIIIPVYNAESFLRRCVESVLAQDFKDYEVLLINDGSTDGSAEICEEYAANDTRIVVFTKENGGVSSARNLGLEKARGEWVSFIDADDWVMPGYFTPLSGSEGLKLVHFGFKEEHISGLIHSRKVNTMPRMELHDFFQPHNFCSSSCTFFFKREMLVHNRICFPAGIKYSEDREFIAKAALASGGLKTVNEPLYFYAANASSATRKARQAETFCDDLKVLRNVIHYADSIGFIWPEGSLEFFAGYLLDSFSKTICLNCVSVNDLRAYREKIRIEMDELSARNVIINKRRFCVRFLYNPVETAIRYKLRKRISSFAERIKRFRSKC